MQKHIYLKLILLLLVGALPVVILHFKSKHALAGRNGFVRLIPAHPFEKSDNLDITYNSYYVAGLSASRIWLGNRTAPLHILSTNFNLTDLRTHKLQLVAPERVFYGALHVRIDSPYVSVSEDITPALYTGTLETMTANAVKIKMKPSLPALYPISKSTCIIRSFDSTFQRNILSKISFHPFSIKEAPHILKKQIDGFFCTDGMLSFDQKTSRFVYLYYYRNQYIYFDMGMNVLREGNTIDTIGTAEIKVDKILSENKTTLTTPPVTVNKRSCIDGDRLYVYSQRISNNETNEVFRKHSVIDVYSLTNGTYQFSFYIPDVNGKKISSFQVSAKNLVAVQDHFLVYYLLSL